MNRLARSLALLAVAGAPPGWALVAVPAGAQDRKSTDIGVIVVEKKGDAAKEAAPKEEARNDRGKETTTKTITVEKSEVKVEKAEAKKDEPKGQMTTKAVVVEKRVAAPAAGRAVGANAMNLEPWTQRFTQQLRPIHRAEIHLVIKSCSPTKEQRATLASDGEKVLKDVALKCAEAQMGNRRNTSEGMPNPSRLIAAGMADVVKERLSPEQAELYRVESEAKAADFKRAAVGNLVAILDEELSLTAEQRASIAGAMTAKWNDAWCGSPQVLLYGSQYFPSIPDDIIMPALNPTQRQAWEKRQKFGNVFWGNFGFMGNAMIEEEADVAPPAPPPVRPAAVEKKADRDDLAAPKQEKPR